MSQKLIFKTLSLLVIFFSFGCNPKLNKRHFFPNENINKPALEQIDSLEQPDENSSKLKLNWNGISKTSEVNEVITNYLLLSQKLADERLRGIAINLYNKLNKEPISLGSSVENTPFFDLFKSKAIPEVKAEVKKVENEIDADLKKVKLEVNNVVTSKKLSTTLTFSESVETLDRILTQIEKNFEKLILYPEFKNELLNQFKEEKKNNLNYLYAYSEDIKQTKELTFLLSQIDLLAKEYSYHFDSETKNILQRAKKLALKIDNVTDSDSALSALIEVWLFLDKNDRITEIKPISEPLYDFLNSRTDEEVKCLVDQSCSGLWDSLMKNLFILPKINTYGIQNIKVKLNERSYEIAYGILSEKFFVVVKNINQRINSMIEKGVLKGKQKLVKIKSNINNYLITQFTDWLKKNINSEKIKLMTFQWPQVQINKSTSGLTFTPINRDDSIDKETIGSYFQLSKAILTKAKLKDSSLKKVLYEQLNLFFSLGGIPDEFPATSIYRSGLIKNLIDPSKPFELTAALSSSDPFSLSDKIYLSSSYTSRKSSNANINLSAKSTALYVLGLIDLVDYYRDWEKNNFDTLLGNVTSSEVFGTEKSVKEQFLFSKAKFFGFLTSHLATVLSNFNKKFTPIGLIDSDNKLLWSNQLAQSTNNAFLYSVFVNIENGTRSEVMNLEDMGLLIEVLAKLVETVDGIEKTQFVEFLKPQPSLDGKSVVQLINENINKVSKAFIPLGNTIANKMKDINSEKEKGLIFNRITTTTFSDRSLNYKLNDQLIALEALLTVYEKTRIQSYLWAALEIFNYLQKFYDPKTNYYNYYNQEPTVPTALRLVKSLLRIKPYLSKSEQVILDERIRLLKQALLIVF